MSMTQIGSAGDKMDVTTKDKAEAKLAVFGWCMDGNDEECIEEFPGYSCSCKCHLDKVASTDEQIS